MGMEDLIIYEYKEFYKNIKMHLFINNQGYNNLGYQNIELNKNSFYQYFELDIFNSKHLISKDQNLKIEIIGDNNYRKTHIINWIQNNIEYYDKILKEGQYMFINCDMYDDFLEFKISIKKYNNQIYLNTIKHIIMD